MTHKTIWIAAAVALAGVLAAGGWWWKHSSTMSETVDGVVQDGSGKRVLYWYDPMVPGAKFDKPGKSPFMDMPLAAKHAGEEDQGSVRISPAMAQNLGIRTEKATVASQSDALQALGRIAFDERDVRSIQIRAGGFIERLYVRAAGDAVTAGQKVAEVYAPDLLAAQQELLALANLREVADLDTLKTAARERLRLLGMSESEIDAVEASRTPRRSIGVYAPVSGVVQELGMREGAQVMPGQTLLQVAGLTRVWVIVDLPERDLTRVRNGQTANIHIAALPDSTLKGKVEYVYPKLDATARTGQVRIQLNNAKGTLRPGMYAQVELAMEKREALTVPSEAVIATGTRSVVLVRENGAFRPVDVKTGPESGGRTEILQGLNAGEEVVLSGQFLIDSEASLRGVLTRLAAADAGKSNTNQATAPGRGVVKNVDAAKGAVTLSHEAIPGMQWPAMTMTFKLRDAKAAQTLKPGAQVTFEVKHDPEGGDYVIESIKEAAK